MAERYVRIFTRFERFWHWSQVILIFILLFSGTVVMGLHQTLAYGLAVTMHTIAAVVLLALWAFATFWLFTTEAWKQFIPTRTGLVAVARFYAWGIFHGEDHPYRKDYHRKHNPLQLLAYLALKLMLFPAIWMSGLAYLLYGFWEPYDAMGLGLRIVANVHIIAAFSIASFVVIHLYLLTTGHGFREHVKPMITGYDKVDLSPEAEAYFSREKPERLARQERDGLG